MSYNKKFTKYPKERREDYMDNTKYSDHSTGPSSEGQIDTLIALKARASLPKSTYAIKADPYEASLPTANPYDLIAPFNKTVGGAYAGTDNLDGGNVQQYANSFLSKATDAFDFSALELAINYRYIPRKLASTNVPVKYGSAVKVITSGSGTAEDPYVYGDYNPNFIGSGLVNMQRQSIAEATSILQATTFTQMAINNYALQTDMPMGDAEMTLPSSNNEYVIYGDLPDVIYGASSYYQIFWQEINSIISALNSFRLKQGTMIRSSWNRETPILNSLFGLFNKKAFLSMVDSVCLSLEGEYIDIEWKDQYNLLTVMPSRRTNSIHDPVLELICQHQHPSKFKLNVVDDDMAIVGTVFNSEEDLTFTDTDGDPITFWEASKEIKELFSAENVMHWARNSAVRAAFRENAYYNRVVTLLDYIQEACTRVKVKFNDVREVFDVMSRTGVNTWTKGYRPSITHSTDAALFDNLIVNDIYKTVFSGATTIKIDPETKRWRSYTMWDLYDGVPSYDAKSGGCFLTFSGKTIVSDDDSDMIKKWVPITFYVDSTDQLITGLAPKMVIVSRNGHVASISPYVARLSALDAFARLVPLPSQSTLNVKIPELQIAEGDSFTTAESSFLISALNNVFGYCKVNGDYYVDPDLLYVYEIEIADVTNDAIRYARINSPFRGAAPEGDTIGFAKFGQA